MCSDIVLDPDYDQVMEDLADWLEEPSDWVGPPVDFRARGFIEDMVDRYEENNYSTSRFTERQLEGVLKIYRAFDVESSMEIVRDYERAASKND